MFIEAGALVVLGVCLIWMVRAPGALSFTATLIAFFVWVGVRITRFVARKLSKARDRVAKNLKGVIQDRFGESAAEWIDAPSEASDLHEDLTRLKSPDLRALAERLVPHLGSEPANLAGRQTLRLTQTLDRFQDILATKLDPRELTYDRYSRIANTTRETLLGQLTETANRLDARAPAVEILQLLDRNENVLNQLDQTNLALSRIRGISRDREHDLALAMEDLRRLEERAKADD